MPTRTVGLRTGELTYGLVVAVDIAGFSKLGILEQAAAQTVLWELMDHASAAAGLTAGHWRYRQPRGDGELAVLDADVDVALVAADWTHHLVRALHEMRSSSGTRLRVRVAMHHGPMTAGRFGPVGEAPIVACRLLDAPPTKAALAADESCDLVMVVSRQFFDDVVASGFHGLAAERFRPMRSTIKGRTYSGNLCLGTPKRVIEAAHSGDLCSAPATLACDQVP